MARATLEMLLKLTGADKTSRGLDKVSKATKELDNSVTRSGKSNAKFAKGMSGLSKVAITGGALFATKSLIDFSKSALDAAVNAEEAAAAFETTFGTAANRATAFLEDFANMAGLTVGEAQQLQATLGAVAQGIGFTQEASADLTIELTKIAADVASFSNISAGAEPVLQAFRSALVGEREALKTYGIAITEAEVQSVALLKTQKRSTDELTRQDKAYATLTLIQEKAAVQIGDLERTQASFANQSRILNAELRQFREEVGEELIPVAAELLPIFREFAFEIAPILIEGFGKMAQSIGDLVLANERLKGMTFFEKYKAQAMGKTIKDLADEYRIFSDRIDLTAETIIQASINQGLLNKKQEQARQTSLKAQVQYKKVADTVDRFLNPIFGEQNALLITNMQLEMDRKKIMELVTSANDDVAAATKNRNSAAKDLQELQIAENIADAEAAIRKNELTTQIGILTRAERDGKDVKAELALAQAELAEAEFELANDSDRLVLARDALNLAESNLEKAIARRSKAIKDSRDMLVYENTALDANTEAKKRNAEATQRQIDLLRRFMEIERSGGGGFAAPPSGGSPAPEPPPLVGDESLVSSPRGGSGSGGGQTLVKIELSDTAEDFLQTTQEKLTKLGYALK